MKSSVSLAVGLAVVSRKARVALDLMIFSRHSGAVQAGFQTDLVADSRNARPKATISMPSYQLI